MCVCKMNVIWLVSIHLNAHSIGEIDINKNSPVL